MSVLAKQVPKYMYILVWKPRLPHQDTNLRLGDFMIYTMQVKACSSSVDKSWV